MICITNNDKMGQNLLYLRREYNLSQDDFARLTGMQTDTLVAIEQGRLFEIEAQIIREICRVFGITVYQFMEEYLQADTAVF